MLQNDCISITYLYVNFIIIYCADDWWHTIKYNNIVINNCKDDTDNYNGNHGNDLFMVST